MLGMTDSRAYLWHRRAGLFLAIHYLRTHAVPVADTPLSELPRLSPRAIRLAIRLFPTFLDRADLAFPIIVAGRGWYQIALDGRHRISKAIWTGTTHLPTVRVPWAFVLELLLPPCYEVEWLFLFLRRELRRAGQRLHSGPSAAHPVARTGAAVPTGAGVSSYGPAADPEVSVREGR